MAKTQTARELITGKSVSQVTQQKVIYSMDEAASQLGLDSLELRRLFFLGEINGTIVGPKPGQRSTDMQIKFLRDNLEEYIAAGANNSTAPQWDAAATWFGDEDYLGIARNTLQEGCSSQLLNERQVVAKFDATGNRTIDVKLRWTDALRAANVISTRTVGKLPVDLRCVAAACGTWARVIAVSLLRRAARDSITETVRKATLSPNTAWVTDALSHLYSERYAEICADAFNRAKALPLLSFSQSFQMKSTYDEQTGLVKVLRDGAVSVVYRMTFGATNFNAQQLCGLAF